VAVENETQIRTQLSRYLSHDVVDGILHGTISLSLGGEKKWGTVLFCDIVGFTSLAENLSALDVVEKLNRYFSLITEIITRHRGTLHKFGGDMVMAFWNVMVPDDLACQNAVRCSLEMQNAIFGFDIQLEHERQRPVYLGIGCNTGEFAGGNIGSADRMEYTVIGDNVNLAQRIESLASRWQVLIAEETYKSVRSECSAIRLLPVLVKGKVQPITVYSIRGILQADNSMLLTIPLVIMTPEGTISGSGLAVRCQSTNGLQELHIVSFAMIPSWNRLLLQFDLPELTTAPRVSGAIQAAYRGTYEGNAAFSHIILTELTGDKDALSLLRSCECTESRKSWADMKRH
jgi:class 3 adenylate cyclase